MFTSEVTKLNELLCVCVFFIMRQTVITVSHSLKPLNRI